MPMIVLLSEPKNSLGAYDGSVATTSVPLLLMAAGTEIDVSADALGSAARLRAGSLAAAAAGSQRESEAGGGTDRCGAPHQIGA